MTKQEFEDLVVKLARKQLLEHYNIKVVCTDGIQIFRGMITTTQTNPELISSAQQ